MQRCGKKFERDSTMKVFNLFGILLLSFTLFFLPAANGQTAGGGAISTPDHIVLTWTGDAATTMTITWRTDPTIASCYVEYDKGASLSKKAQQATAEGRDFKTDIGDFKIFSTTLASLSPDKKYTYRIGYNGGKTKAFSFTTAKKNAKKFKFLIFGDSQSSIAGDAPYSVWRETVHKAYQTNPDAKFMVNVGDLVDFGLQGAHWDAWFAAAKGVIDSIPIMPVSGNHESYGPRKIATPQYYLEQFSLPQNGPEGLKGHAYSYDYGPVHFVVLDSQQLEQQPAGDILKPQQAWLEADLAASKAQWKIALFHRSPYGVKPNRDEEEIRKAFCPILEKHHVNLVFTAHDHGVARTPPMNNGVEMKTASEGTIYFVVGQSGGKTYKDNVKREFHSFFYNPLDQPNYLVLEATKEKITIKTINQDGTLIDAFSVDSDGRFEQQDQSGLKKAA
jgi:acid phosphatase type 7